MASIENQINMIGPKELPMKLVPNCCIKKSAAKINSTIGTTGIWALKSFNPSIAEVTVIEGVITPSARSAAAPTMVRIAAQAGFLFNKGKKRKYSTFPLIVSPEA